MAGPGHIEGPRAWVTLLLILAAIAYPMARGKDDYPLSTYPMFARPRPARELVDRAVGVRGLTQVQLPPRLLGSEEPMQVVMTLGRAIHDGRADALCRDIASRVSAEPTLAGVDGVEIVTEEHDALAWFASERPRPLTQVLRARCGVGR